MLKMEKDMVGKLNKSHGSGFNISKTILRWTCHHGQKMTYNSNAVTNDIMVMDMYVANHIASKYTKHDYGQTRNRWTVLVGEITPFING